MESQFSKLKAELSVAQAKESELTAKIDLGSLITARSVKVINALLEGRCSLRLNGFPVSFARIGVERGSLCIQAIFSQPVFSGWRTETPCESYQSCSWSLETPELPSKNHIPQYQHSVDWRMRVVCWEQDGNELHLWLDARRRVTFCWEGGVA